jgi:hypothetical protein
MSFGFKILEGDFIIENKKLIQVIDNDKLLRDFRKFLMTESEDANNLTTYDRYNPKYGTNINNKSLYTNLSTSSVISLINQNLSNNIKYYVTLQEGRSNLSLGEIITNIEFMTFSDPNIKTQIDIAINVIIPGNNVLSVGTFTQSVV